MNKFSSTLFSFLTITLLQLPVQSAFGNWQEVGNGGHVLYCSMPTGSGGGTGRYLNMYDYIETEIRYNLIPQIPDVSFTDTRLPEVQIAVTLLNRIHGVSPEWLNNAQNLILNFYSEVREMKNVELVLVADMGMGFIPETCKLRQLFLQSPPIAPEDRYYKLNANLWNGMFPEQRATGILHEVLYRLSPSARAAFSSEKIRYVVALLLSDTFKNKNDAEAVDLLKSAGLL